MDIRSLLQKPISKFTSQSIIDYIEKHPVSLTELIDCLFDKNIRICQRAAGPLDQISKLFPDLILPYLPVMIKNLENPIHDTIVRNTIRSWQNLSIPEEYQGIVFEKCLSYVTDPKAAIAIRVFSMTVCAHIAINIPELKEELYITINDHLEMGSPGILNRGTKILKALKVSDSVL